MKEISSDIPVTFPDSQTYVVADIEGDEHEFSVGDEYGFISKACAPTWLTCYLYASVLVVPSGQDPSTAHLQSDTENWVAKIRKIAQHENGDVGHPRYRFYFQFPDLW